MQSSLSFDALRITWYHQFEMWQSLLYFGPLCGGFITHCDEMVSACGVPSLLHHVSASVRIGTGSSSNWTSVCVILQYELGCVVGPQRASEQLHVYHAHTF